MEAKKKEAGGSGGGGGGRHSEVKDQVAYVKIWTEFVEKERELQEREYKHPREFRVNPRGLTVLPPKISQFNPLKVSDEEPSAEQRELFSKWRTEMDQSRKGPRQKWYFTQTEAQEIGWAGRPRDLRHGRSKGKWRFGREKCDVVTYADCYTMAMGKNPYTQQHSTQVKKPSAAK